MQHRPILSLNGNTPTVSVFKVWKTMKYWRIKVTKKNGKKLTLKSKTLQGITTKLTNTHRIQRWELVGEYTQEIHRQWILEKMEMENNDGKDTSELPMGQSSTEGQESTELKQLRACGGVVRKRKD